MREGRDKFVYRVSYMIFWGWGGEGETFWGYAQN